MGMGKRDASGRVRSYTDKERAAIYWASVDRRGPKECWPWTAKLDVRGYGCLPWAGMRYAHRFSYELANGPMPAGTEIDHNCRNRACQNPAHLDAVTAKENMRRAPGWLQRINKEKTHCKHGHEFTPENTRHYLTRGWPGRGCRACQRKRDAARSSPGKSKEQRR